MMTTAIVNIDEEKWSHRSSIREQLMHLTAGCEEESPELDGKSSE